MDRFELVEKLVKSTGVSYEDAKSALESSGWDLLDAAVWLEKNGKVETKTGHFSTNPEQQQEQQEAQEQQKSNEAPKGAASSQSNGGRIIQGLIRKIRNILMDNELVICKQSGEIFLEIPIWLAILLLVVAFWATIVVLVIVFLLGFRFRLHGPDIGGKTVNRILNRAEDAAAGFVSRVKQALSSNGSNNRNDDVIDYEDLHRKE